ncbi:MAG: MYXO-CTERM sorting domain-containing protein [Sandaracinaceae bacterium]
MRGNIVRAFVLWALTWGVAASASAQLSLTTVGTPVVETFNTFLGTGFSPTPAPGQLDSDAWIVLGMSDGTMAFGDSRVTGDFARLGSLGGETTGGVYAFTVAPGDVALGIQATGSDAAPGAIVARAQNNTPSTITQITVALSGGWLNDAPRATSVSFGASTDGTTFTAVGTPFATPEAADASPAWFIVPLSFTVPTSVAPGGFFYFRIDIADLSGGGSRDELALASFSMTVDTVMPPCTSAADCNDSNPCTTDVCTAGACSHAPTATGTACPDADLCNGDETCDGAGACVAGTPPTCSGTNPCATYSCVAASGCVEMPVAAGTACSDGNACNGAEVCMGLTCMAGTALDCDDANACTTDTCDMTAGCMNAPVFAGTSCSDGDMCNGDETCDGSGACMTGTALDCDDSDECTTDSCEAATGCANAPIAMCGDGGMTGSDAGMTGTDAGPIGGDAGPRTDGGGSGRDGGAGGADAGDGDSGGGCTCRATGRPSSAPGAWMMALVACAWIARRRRG